MTGLINAKPPGVVAVRRQRCENCAYVHPPTSAKEMGTCRFNPPTAVLVMVGQNTKGMPVMQPGGVFPPVGPADYCYRWKVKVAGVVQSANDAEQVP